MIRAAVYRGSRGLVLLVCMGPHEYVWRLS